ncbi:MAG: KamA family radical SAM protein [Pseudomonadota bacterium]
MDPNLSPSPGCGVAPAWWRRVPAWSELSTSTFRDVRWQLRNTVRTLDALQQALGHQLPARFLADAADGLARSPMELRLTPHVVSLIDWSRPWADPVRRQFLPLGSEHEPDHPMARLDSLAERRDTVLPGLVHRYPRKVLFLTLDVCPVYCRCCTRSYAVGSSTEAVTKGHLASGRSRLDQVVDYLQAHPEVDDVVLSGGDTSLLPAGAVLEIGERLLGLGHIRRLRFGSKLMAVLPQRLLSDEPWLDALTRVAQLGHERGCEVALHTHVNHPRELTPHTRDAARALWERRVTMRNQSVLQRGVNDDADTMLALLRGLARLHIQPYYVYNHDVVAGVECLRTTLRTAAELEKSVRGALTGFDTPTFVCDVVGGGGKRDLHSWELYDERLGLAIYRSPAVEPERVYYAFDPLSQLEPAARRAWNEPGAPARLVQRAMERAGLGTSH